MRKIGWLLWCAFFAGILSASSQDIFQPQAARYPTLTAYSAKVADVFSARTNGAALASLQHSGIGAYGENRFMLDGLNFFAAGAAWVTRSGAFGLQAGYYGANGQNQTQLALQYGRKVGAKVDIGAGFHYHQLTQPSYYGNARAMAGSLGLMFHLSSKVHMGFSAFNPLRAKWGGAEDERMAARYGFGFGYDASDKLFVGAEISKEERLPVDVQMGLQYRIIPQLYFRGGLSTQRTGYFAGLGWQTNGFRIDIATSYHQQLGFSPGAMIIANLGKRKPSENNTANP